MSILISGLRTLCPHNCSVNPKQSMFLLLCFFLLLFYSSDLAIAIRSSELRSDQFQYKNIFILAGQSNMAGRGGVIDDKWDGIVPPKCQSNSLVLRFNARSNWEEAREPLHADIDVNKTCGIGPGMAFANSIREIDPRIGTIGLVPCAIGGTNISEWHHGMSLYNNLVNRAKAALKQGGTIRAILWYQGESDTISRTDADSYGLNLKKLMLDLRVDLDSPMLPIIQVALASGQGAFVEIVRKAQLGLQLSNVRCIDAKGLQLEPDGLHLTTLSQVQLGQMFALEFIKTLQNPVAFIRNNVSRSNSNLFQELCMSSLWRSLLTFMILLLIM